MDLEYQAALKAIARKHGFEFATLKARCQSRRFIEARRECYAYLRGRGWSYPEIGAHFERDHTTVIYTLNPATHAKANARHLAYHAAKRVAREAGAAVQ